MSGMHLSKEFFELIKSIGEAKSKQEEDRIVTREIATLKKKLETPSLLPSSPAPSPLVGSMGGSKNAMSQLTSNKKKAREFLVRVLYVEMLGHDGSFGYMKAVELAASSSIVHKRTGYLVCACCLSPEHEFRFMLVNQMQRDLVSSNVLESCGALTAATNLITSDLVGTVSPQVMQLLEHASETVRKKAVVAMHRFHQLAPEAVTAPEVIEKVRRLLCDRDPSVMGATLNVIEAMARHDPMPFKDLVPSLVSILKQICERRLPSDYDYHRIPAPWMQMKIVRILAVLGKNDSVASDGTYEILGDCLKKAEEAGINASNAIAYEAVRTITAIYPNPALLDAAAKTISRFLASRSQNLRYLGITGLASIVERHPRYAADHQLAVIECLEDRDETLLRKTLDLLYKMTNPVNVEFITERLLHFLRGSTDPFLRQDLTHKICRIAERYAPDNAWYVRVVTELFRIAGDLVNPTVATNLMSLVAEGTGSDVEDEEADALLRKQAVDLYVTVLAKPPRRMPRVLVETMAWVLGEYGYLSSEMPLATMIEAFCKLLSSGGTSKLGGGAASTRRLVLGAIMKLVAQYGSCPGAAAKVVDDYTRSQDPDAQKRCLEFQTLLTTAPQLLGEVFPVDASLEDVDVDENLRFLDGMVMEAVSNGAQPYDKPDYDDDDDLEGAYGGGAFGSDTNGSGGGAFNTTPYEKPSATHGQGIMRGIGSGSMGPNATNANGVSLPPGSAGAGAGAGMAAPGYGGDPHGGQAHAASVPSEPQLVLRAGAGGPWGKAQAPANPLSPPTNAEAVSTSAQSHVTPSPYGGFGSPAVAAAPVAAPIPKTEEQLAKERMAAGLFGGIGATAPPPPPPPAVTVVAPPPAVVRVAPVAPQPPAPVAPAPPAAEVDLLDMGSWGGDTGGTSSSAGSVDMLAPTPFAEHTAAAAPPPPPAAAPIPTPVPSPAAPPKVVDPFADAGLLGDFTPAPAMAPLSAPSAADAFEHGGVPIAPLALTTAQFGEHWGQCPATSSAAVPSSTSISTLSQFMALCERAGMHRVEEIAATNEGIVACMAGGGASVALVHGKITPSGGAGRSSKVDVTVKSTDAQLGGSLAMYLQNMIR